MAERTWLAIILCCLVWFGYIRYFAPPPPTHTPTTTASTQAPTESSAKSETTSTASNPFAETGTVSSLEKWIDSDDAVVSVSADGGRIAQVQLPHYTEALKKDSPIIEPINPTTSGASLNLLFSDASLSKFASAKYSKEENAEQKVFHAKIESVGVKKTYRRLSPFFIEAHYEVTGLPNKGNLGYAMIPVGGEYHFEKGNPLKSWEVVFYQNDSVSRRGIDSIKDGEEVIQGNTGWLAFDNRYFATSMVNRSTINPDVVLTRKAGFVGAYLRYPVAVKEGSNGFDIKVDYFIGPKEYSELSKVPGMKSLIDYGRFSILAYPLLEILRFFYQYVHNFGVAIILLTLLVRLLFYPLASKSARSMKAMQKLQPQIQVLKEKYKDDMQRLNQEQMALFKAHNVNPMGGCLPMLVQLPVFIALYAVLGNSIELFHAPFILWIKDLSAKDPYYILPGLMGIAFFGQQRMTPTVGMDPVQAKMMYFMPVIFTFMMISLPAGLTGYIFLSTLFGIVQQYIINREHRSNPVLVRP